jgi:hypothetical protein
MREIEGLELVPFGDHGNRVRASRRLIRARGHTKPGLRVPLARDFLEDLVGRHLGVVNHHPGLFREQVTADRNGGRFPGVVRVFFEGEPKHCDALLGDRVVQ